ncbi:PepSY domain-containing protein [Montanilutibacter psychrotolerans]|uniref:Flavodoxin n=1 Tax=Montanilutibacter psychrotolerans TaxID=1327343 RepID=A0A3M8SXQ7_9GAMM|nr:PepSY domain-containing protein [Lysobacter psychrotolerans]RNF86079.1 flavodoxin [Lysobacter psychrotolerans]
MTLRNAIFQVHWFLGITAGLVLALVGATGAMLSFEDEILKAINPGVMTVEPKGQPMSPRDLVERVRAQAGEDRIQSLTLSSDPADAAKVGFAARKDAPKGPMGRPPRGETRMVDPYTGALLAKPRGEAFFSFTMKLHRWLVADKVGKQIVGFSTVVLVFFCLSGIYLRWPRRWMSPRAWLALDWRQKGRNFLWHLHSIVGTWVLVAYLVMALTGLTWSYEWYRNGLNALAGVPTKQEAGGKAGLGGRKGKQEGKSAQPIGETSPAEPDVALTWGAFNAAAPAWSTATMQWPRDGGPVQFRYLDLHPTHERASNSLEVDPTSLLVRKHERYDDKPLGQRLAGSYFALHRGSYFGTVGVVLFMLASLLMPLFAITGWMLYLDRRRKQHAARALSRQQPASAAQTGRDTVLIAFASQTGSAEQLAWQTAAVLREAGLAVDVRLLGKLQPDQLLDYRRALFVVSTFGDGEAPDNGRAFVRRMRAGAPPLACLQHAVLALGDTQYENYCTFGRELDHWLHHAGAQPLFDRVEVDAGDNGALRHWQHHVGLLAGRTDLPDWSTPSYRPWRLVERRQINAGSPGGPAFHLALAPNTAADLNWQAGDIAEIGPRHGADDVARWLDAAGFTADAPVRHGEATTTLGERLAASRLPDPAAAASQSAQAVADALQPLPHREYSIASLPADGSLQLLVRRMRHNDGRLGSGSGWLTEHAAIGTDIDLRIRSNPSFHAPTDARPVLLIGNGTGLAGLRAVLKARIAAGHHRNWLLFGERSRPHDRHYGDELDAWLASGQLQHLDLTFSRDQPGPGDAPRHYVQHLLAEHGTRLRDWLADGAAVYVCGSLEGMAPAVDAVLREVVGEETLETMATDGRYRRDVY